MLLDGRAYVTTGKVLRPLVPAGPGSGLDADTLDAQDGLYYVARGNHTGTQAPATISPQGAGSGLNADLLDGISAAGFDAAGTAAGLLGTHEGAPDPHPGYVTTAEGAALITAHEAAGNPHPVYLTAAEGDAVYAPLATGVTNGDTHDHVGGDGATIAYGGLSGIPSTFAPTAHASTHQNGGADEITVAGLSGLLADGQTPLGHAHVAGDITGTAVLTADARLSDARTPLAHSILGAEHTGFPGGTATFLRADNTFAAPTAEAAVTLTTVEKDLGSVPHRSGTFTITGAGLVAGKPVLIQQAVGPYTGKGTRADEAEMDRLSLSASVVDATTIRAYWTSQHQVRGNFRVNYLVSS